MVRIVRHACYDMHGKIRMVWYAWYDSHGTVCMVSSGVWGVLVVNGGCLWSEEGA